MQFKHVVALRRTAFSHGAREVIQEGLRIHWHGRHGARLFANEVQSSAMEDNMAAAGAIVGNAEDPL